MVKTRLAYPVFKNKKYQDGIGTDKPLYSGLVVKTWLGYAVFKNYEKQDDFDQGGIEQVGTDRLLPG